MSVRPESARWDEVSLQIIYPVKSRHSMNRAWKGTFILVTPWVIKLQCVTNSRCSQTSVALTFPHPPTRQKDVFGGGRSDAHSSGFGLGGHPPALKHRKQRVMSSARFCQPNSFPSRDLISLLSCSPWGCFTALKYAQRESCGQPEDTVLRHQTSSVFFPISPRRQKVEAAIESTCSACVWAWFSISSPVVCRHFICILEGYANHLWWLIWLFKNISMLVFKGERVIFVSGYCVLFRNSWTQNKQKIQDISSVMFA